MSDLTFTVRVQDYDGDQPLTADRIEQAVTDMLDAEGSDGVVIVEPKRDPS